MTSSDADERGNWLALLKWSLKNSNDGTNPDTNPASVSEEDRAFLENAMKQVQNTPERLRVIMVMYMYHVTLLNDALQITRHYPNSTTIIFCIGGTHSYVKFYFPF